MRYSWDKVEQSYDLYEDDCHIGTLYTEDDEWRYITLRGNLGEWELVTVTEKIDTIRLDELFENIEPTENL
jgi:hypothetical protein